MVMDMGKATEDSNENQRTTVRLVIDTKANKVMFAEGSKDFVDFLFTLLFLRLANIIRLISVDDNYVLPHMLARRSNSNIRSRKQASCASDDSGAVCPRTCNQTGQEGCSGSGGGFVIGVVTYMVMDHLEIKPLSAISSLEAFRIEQIQIGAVEVRTVSIGITEGVRILRASFQTENVLSHVFLENQKCSLENEI